MALGNLKREEAVPALIATLEKDPDPLVRGHAAWALGQIRTREAERALYAARAREMDSTVLEEVQASIDAFSAGLIAESSASDGIKTCGGFGRAGRAMEVGSLPVVIGYSRFLPPGFQREEGL